MFSSLSWLYGRVADLRNTLYDKGVFEARDPGARTISIGNITAGGTGKTPLVGYVAEILAARGEKVCILTRGYGRTNPKDRVLVSDGNEILALADRAGDEPFELARKLIGKAIVIADADRSAAAEWAKRKFQVTTFVLDDGFQHRKVKRDLDIVCIDATDPFGGRQMLPAGRLREPIANLNRADVIVITRSEVADNISDLKCEISNWNSAAPTFCSNNRIVACIELEKFHDNAASNLIDVSLENGPTAIKADLGGKPVLGFSGIGNPDNFHETIRKNDINLVATESFADHHRYTQQNILDVEMVAQTTGAKALVTTAKDAVKLSNLKFEIPCFVVAIEIILDDPAGFAKLI